MERVTPELALVDPALAGVWRLELPDPPDCLTRVREPTQRSAGVPSLLPPLAVKRLRRPSVTVAVAALLLAGLIGLPTLDRFSYRGLTIDESSVAWSSRTLGAAVSDAARLELRWPAISGANHYAVFVFTNGRPAGALRTTATAVHASSVRASTGSRLGAGAYTWLVVGVLDDGSRWSEVLARGSFRVLA